MKRLLRLVLVINLLALAVSIARAHYNMLLPQSGSVKKGESVLLVYQWGHPFEHELFDAPAPEAVFAVAPDGKKIDLSKELEKFEIVGADGKKATAYRFRFTAEQRGDYLFVLRTAPIWMPEGQEFLQDTVRSVLHVQAERGWDAAAGLPFEVLPLTRPYGLQPGMAFQAQVETQAPQGGQPLRNGAAARGRKPFAGAIVEIEHYHAAPPAMLPSEEHITRTAKTDPNGVLTCTLTDAGWWCLTARRDGGVKQHEGKEYPVRQRSTLWVFVDEPVTPK